MKILSLDISTKTGYAYFEDGKLKEYGLIQLKDKEGNVKKVDDFGSYPENYQLYTLEIANKIKQKMESIVSDDFWEDGMIVIEETTKSKAVYTQKMLEFIHCQFIRHLSGKGYMIKYVKTGEWRKVAKLVLSKKDKEQNKLVRAKKARGIITKKHLSVRKANELFDLHLKLKDNDIADALVLGWAAHNGVIFTKDVLTAYKNPTKSKEIG